MPPKYAFVWMLLALILPAARADGDYVDGAALYEAGLTKFWQLRLPLREGQEIADSYLVDDQIYLTTRDGYVHAVHAYTGVIRWIKQVTTAGYRVRQPCHAGDRTVFVTPPAVLQYDRYSGEPIRKLELRFPAASPAVSDGVRFYVGGIDQRIYSFYLDDDFEDWKIRAGGQVSSQPALVGEHLYFASEDGTVYACVAKNKQFRWRARTVGSITADVAVDPDGVYAASRDHSLYMFDPTLGGLRWRTRFSGPLYEPPIIVAGIAFQYCPDEGLAAINTGTVAVEERVRWILPRGRKLLTADERRAYVLSRDEDFLVVRLDDGKILHTIAAPGLVMPMSSPDDLALYIASRDGRVFCARKRGVPIVKAEQLPEVLRQTGGAEEAAVAPAEEPEEKPAAEGDYLRSRRTGPPVGAKSKVSKQYAGE